MSPRAGAVRPRESREEVRARLLDAAELLFAERGFRAASLRAITARAGCNVAAVNYHFGGKDALYEQMFRRRLVALRDQRLESIRRAAADEGPGALERLLEEFAGAFLAPHLGSGGERLYFKLVAREMVDPHLPVGVFAKEMIEPVETALIEAMRRLRPGLDAATARLCSHSVVGQILLIPMQQTIGKPAGPADSRAVAEAIRHIARFSAAGIRTLGSAPAAAGERPR